ncbi:MAG: hypothetical protein EZS26_001507 [Candidatus Ordinivivax streblomastigis]|uniref:Lipoprotein n=1 Tax=Candidatus Ordinivivax streblomastigis TaxID=2540710 RepID=A0A5M8P1X8_9BACT|nr:MAG: hypothetical protein EZS26_001507 [Candidatus Ordinivivax streblomastigis]
MKQFIFTAIIAVFLTSCVATTSYYQVYKVNPTNELSKTANSLIYEDENCKVLYDFWGQGGKVDFLIYNKTSENIYVNKEESFFIYNGIAYDYYKDRVFTNSSSSSLNVSNSNTAMYSNSALNAIGLSVTGFNYQGFKQTAGIASAAAAMAGIATTNTKGITTLSGSSVSTNEEKIVCIPSGASKIITEYNITKSLYRDCNLFKYPSKKQIKSTPFTESESPFIFSNKIAYTVGKSDNLVKVENKFYVSEISNYPEEEITETKSDEFCGEKSTYTKLKYFKNVSPDKFYIQYDKRTSEFKH